MIDASLIKHVACFWYLSGDGFDLMASVYQKSDYAWEAILRNRYYGSSVSDRSDNWHVLDNPEKLGCQKVEEAMDKAFKAMSEEANKKFQKIEIRGDLEKFHEVMSKHSWFEWNTEVTRDGNG